MNYQSELTLKGDEINDRNQKLILITDILRAKTFMGEQIQAEDFDRLYDTPIKWLDLMLIAYDIRVSAFMHRKLKAQKT